MRTAFLLMTCLLLPLVAGAQPPSGRFWDPFRGTRENLAETVRYLLGTARAEVESRAGRAVSRFKIPDPSRIGFRDVRAYVRAFVGFRSRAGDLPVPPSPAPGDDARHNRPLWAADCSCRRGDPCPDNPNQQCEDCRAITRGPSTIATPEECRERSHVESFDVD